MENYNKLLKKAKEAYSKCVTDAEKRRLEAIFPELKESKDEKIIKELLAFLKENLEKGGNAEETWDSTGLERWIAWLEKQGEQKISDKIEPKFHLEDCKWYVCTRTFVLRGKIVVIKGQVYQSKQNNTISGEDGCVFVDKHDGRASEYFRPWTIEDAKEGMYK